MSTRIAAALVFRIIALWLLLEGASSLVGYGVLRSGLDRHGQSSRPAADVATYATAVQQWRHHALSVGLPRVFLGGILLVAAKPLGKIVAHGLE